EDYEEGANLAIGHLLAASAAKKIISEAIEFVNEVIREEQLSDTEKARYTAVLYFFRLLLNSKKKIEASETVAEVTRELIQSFCEKFPSKSLLNDELVSLRLATYLRSQKFKISPVMVKNYAEQQIFPQLNTESNLPTVS
ncbi:1414_t:CDS:2, partial [Diversispora eburnea]